VRFTFFFLSQCYFSRCERERERGANKNRKTELKREKNKVLIHKGDGRIKWTLAEIKMEEGKRR